MQVHAPHSVAIATSLQVANAQGAFATVPRMSSRLPPEVSARRIEFLGKVVAKAFGGKNAALGRRLGYLDGSYVGQMLKGTRPITEGMVTQLEELPEVRHAGLVAAEAAPRSTDKARGFPTLQEALGVIREQLLKGRAAARAAAGAALGGLAAHPDSELALAEALEALQGLETDAVAADVARATATTPSLFESVRVPTQKRQGGAHAEDSPVGAGHGKRSR